MKKFFSFFAALLFAGSMMATEVTFTKADFAGQGTANTGSEVSATKDGVTFTFSKGYCADESLRCYAHGALTISAESTIEKINFTTTGGKNGGLDAEVTVGATTYSVADLASQARFTEIKVTLAGETPSVATPVISGEAEFTESTQVTISCATEGAAIYYTLDGADPTTNSLPYDDPFTLNETATVKAVAYDSENSQYSAIASKTFTKKEPLAEPTDCATAAAAALSVSANNELYNNGAVYTIEGYVTGIKTAYSDQYHNISFWMADAADGGEVLQAYRAACASEADAPAVGDKVAVTGTLTKYGTTPEFSAGCTYVIMDAPVVDEWAEIVFTEAVTDEDLAEDASFTLEGSEFAATITDPDNKMSIDANTARFGTVEAFKDYTHRLKTGGKSSSTKNFITLNIPEDGQLRIAVRTGSNSATDRNLVIAQGVDTLYNQVVKEEDKTVVTGEESSTNYYPYIIVDVNAGSVVLSYPINGLNFYAFAFKAGEVVPPTPEHTYTVAGGSDVLFGTTWAPANTANDMALVEGLYTWEKSELTLAAGNIQFKVCEDHGWDVAYPAQNYELAIAEAGIYTITITFNAETKEVNAVATKTGEAVVVPTVAMHGNFLGSWADTENFAIAQDNASASLTLTLAEGNYEFGMRIGGSGNWTANGANLTREANTTNLAEGSGNMHIAADVAGDYVFTYTYETQVLEVVYPEAPAAIEVTLSSITTPGSLIWTDAVAEEGWWQIMGANEACDFSLSNAGAIAEAAGTYTVADLDATYSYINIYGENDTTKVAFVDGSVTVAVSEEGIVTLNGTLVGSDGNNYIFNLTYKDPVAEKTVNVAIPEWQLIDDYVAAYRLFAVSGMEQTSAYVQLALWMPQGATEIYGDYTEEDFDLQNFGCYVADANGAYRIFSATINVAKAENGRVLVTADLLCYNNTLYKVTTTIGEGINAVEAAQKAVKMIQNGQVEIIKNGVHYNINGAVVR